MQVNQKTKEWFTCREIARMKPGLLKSTVTFGLAEGRTRIPEASLTCFQNKAFGITNFLDIVVGKATSHNLCTQINTKRDNLVIKNQASVGSGIPLASKLPGGDLQESCERSANVAPQSGTARGQKREPEEIVYQVITSP